MSRGSRVGIALLGVLGLALFPLAASFGQSAGVFEGPVPRAECGPGSRPETALQGQVPLEDRTSGRSASGYRCNLELVGQHQGEGASLMGAWYDRCYFYGTAPGAMAKSPGVRVIDASDPKQPKLTTTLATPATTEPWESLKVHEGRGLLAAVQLGPAFNPPTFFGVYDVKSDCTAPRLLATLPLPLPEHEGTWSPDGNTYWAGHWAGGLTAIDVSDPRQPRVLYVDDSRTHGLSLSADGNTAYLAVPATLEGEPNGLRVVDVSEVQARRPLPRIHTLGTLFWADGGVAQLTIPVAYGGRPFLVVIDESGSPSGDRSGGIAGFRSPAGATRIIDISDVSQPRIISKLKLEIQMPEHAGPHRADTEGNGAVGYQAHYCNVDQPVDPTALACSYFQSGIRVFDIRDPYRPGEIAYFNPPARIGSQAELQASAHVSSPFFVFGSLVQKLIEDQAGLPKDDSFPQANLTADWCTSQVRFYRPRNELWTHCTDNGFMILKLTNAAYPLPPREAAPIPPTPREHSAQTQARVAGAGSATEAIVRTGSTPFIGDSQLAVSARRRPTYTCVITAAFNPQGAGPDARWRREGA